MRAVLDDRVDRGDHGFAAFQREALLPDVLRVEEALEQLRLVHAAQDAGYGATIGIAICGTVTAPICEWRNVCPFHGQFERAGSHAAFDVHALEHGRHHLDVLFARAVHGDLTARDLAGNGRAAGALRGEGVRLRDLRRFGDADGQVPMRDGLKLAADLYLPEGQGPFPVILERTPYNKNNCKFTQGMYFAERGYAVVSRAWKVGDRIDFELPMKPQIIHPSDKIEATRGKVALRYGPLIYNVETVDQPNIELPLSDGPICNQWRGDLLGGVLGDDGLLGGLTGGDLLGGDLLGGDLLGGVVGDTGAALGVVARASTPATLPTRTMPAR